MYSILLESCVSVSGNQQEESKHIFGNFMGGYVNQFLYIPWKYEDKMTRQTRLSKHTTPSLVFFVAKPTIDPKIS